MASFSSTLLPTRFKSLKLCQLCHCLNTPTRKYYNKKTVVWIPNCWFLLNQQEYIRSKTDQNNKSSLWYFVIMFKYSSGSGSPLGELMDHGIDSNCMWMLPVSLMSKFSLKIQQRIGLLAQKVWYCCKDCFLVKHSLWEY